MSLKKVLKRRKKRKHNMPMAVKNKNGTIIP
jgi:hypothetical protein